MKVRNVHALRIAVNVCDQMLREVGQYPEHGWSVAHVVMNPRAWSLLHRHQKIVEVYIITRGTGNLTLESETLRVQAGDAIFVPTGSEHGLTNTGMAALEHLVIAAPPFDPADVEVLSEERPDAGESARILPQTDPELCFDGAEILSYAFDEGPSIAFGWVTSNPERRKHPHFHKETTEWVYVVEGSGIIEVNGEPQAVREADWVRIDPEERHAFRNDSEQHMVVACICSPQFRMEDVHYD